MDRSGTFDSVPHGLLAANQYEYDKSKNERNMIVFYHHPSHLTTHTTYHISHHITHHHIITHITSHT